MTRKIRCFNCGHTNINKDHCEKCGVLIDPLKIREKQNQDRIDLQKEKIDNKEQSKIGRFIEKNRNHKNIIIRFFFTFLYSIWIVVMAIGAFFAWLAATIAA